MTARGDRRIHRWHRSPGERSDPGTGPAYRSAHAGYHQNIGLVGGQSVACPPFHSLLDDGWWARRYAPLPTLRRYATAAITTTILPVVTCSPSATSIDDTVPATPAVCTCSIFIASSVITGCPAATCSPALTSTATTRPFIAARTLPSPPASAADAGAASVRSSTAIVTPRCRTYSRSPSRKNLADSIMPSVRKRIVSEPSSSISKRSPLPSTTASYPPSRPRTMSTSCAPCPRSIRIVSGNVAARLRPLRQGGAWGLVT